MLVHLAVIQELIGSAIPERDAVVCRGRTLTYRDLMHRSRQVGHALARLGLGCHTERRHLAPWESGQDHVALYLYNGPEYLEAMYGAYKARAVAVNINYRYVDDELVYVLATSGTRVIVYHSALASRLAAIRDRLPRLEHFLQVPDESGAALLPGARWYDEVVAAEPTTRLDLPYSPDDLYVLFTGGTTGMPKGVLWRQEDVFFNGLGGHVPGFDRLETETQILEHIDRGLGGRFLVCLPFMHGAGWWTAFNTFHRGGTVVLPDETRRLDPDSVWRTVERERCDQITMVGDAFARPLLETLRRGNYDASTIRVVMSTAAVLSPAVKQELAALLPPGTLFIESVGGSEMGLQAMSFDTTSERPGIPSYELRPGTVVLREDCSGVLDPVTARAGEQGDVGWIASTGHLPLGYLGDAERTRATFPMIGDVRYVVGGDRACYGADGRVLFLGRESSCINTGGEKVYVEEVERVVKSHPAVYDAVVVGVPSQRWGQQVTAVVSLVSGAGAPTVEGLQGHCETQLARYKLPRAVVVAPEIVRSPSGKPDYAWARQYAIPRVMPS